MKIYDIKICIKGKNDSNFWKTIGTVFCNDNAKVCGFDGKPATFVIDYPATQGIIVARKAKKENKEEGS